MRNILKSFLLTFLFLQISFVTIAQEQAPIRVGYINSTELLNATPSKKTAEQKLQQLNENYKQELKMMENEYNKKYSDYITYQNNLSENIKLRRMQELTELENKMQEFMQLAQTDIEQQEKNLIEPIKKQISDIVSAVGKEYGFTVIFDIATPGVAFVTPDAIDANYLVKERLGIK